MTLRRAIDGYDDASPSHLQKLVQTLQLLEKAVIPAPRVLLDDSEGAYFGVPALVLSVHFRRVSLPQHKPAALHTGLPVLPFSSTQCSRTDTTSRSCL